MLNLRKKDELRNSSFSWGMMLCLGAAIPAESVVGMVGFGPVDIAEDGLDSSSVTLP
jgi:hypothetical protein